MKNFIAPMHGIYGLRYTFVKLHILFLILVMVCCNAFAEKRPEFIKLFLMLNSVEHEILNAHKSKNIKKLSFFSDSDKPRMLFFLPINVKMPTIVGILTYMSRKHFMLN